MPTADSSDAEGDEGRQGAASGGRWQPLSSVDRRVAGVLVEKAKTTPDAYPMSLKAICTACNQKNNRDPVMDLDPDAVEESLERLRRLGAVGVIEGYGRVPKHRHYMYEWLGVDKVELAVMAELLLRGPQTEGELRGRAARMEPIADVTALRPILRSLDDKGLIVRLTPEGRGHVLCHALYPPAELERARRQYAPSPVRAGVGYEEAPAATAPPSHDPQMTSHQSRPLEGLRNEMAGLRAEVTQLRSDVDALAASLRQTDDQLRQLRHILGG
jgi:uncharacterized protein YceH (UPF0502 family)